MSGARQTERPERYQKWADVKRFLVVRCRAPEHASELTVESVLYAHYRRWAYLGDELAVSAAEFGKRLRQTNKPASGRAGVNLFKLWLLDVGTTATERKTQQPQQPRGDVEITRDVTFNDGTLSAGEICPYLPCTTAGHVIVLWRGKRRKIGTDSARRMV